MLLMVTGGIAMAHEEESPAIPIPSVFQSTPNVQLEPSEIPGLYRVIAGRNIFYVSQDGKHLLVGRLLNAANGEDLTARAEQRMMRPFFDALFARAGIKIGNGPKQAIVFLDPDCPFCRRVWPELFRVTDTTVAVHLMGKPRVLAQILCQGDPATNLKSYFRGEQPESPIEVCPAVWANEKEAQLAQVHATPTFFFGSTLEWRQGFLSAEELGQVLAVTPNTPITLPSTGENP